MLSRLKKIDNMSDEELFSFVQYDPAKAEQTKSSGYS